MTRPTVAVLVERIGPYHRARLEAVAARSGRDRVQVIEIAGGSRRYAWDPIDVHGLSVTRLFAGRDYDDIPVTELRESVSRALCVTGADVLAVNGWGFPEARSAISWSARAKIPVVLMSDSQEHDARRWFPIEWIKRRYVRACASAFVAGARHSEYIQKLGMPPDHIVLGYDVVDNAHFQSGADRARGDDENERRKLNTPRRYWLCCARFVRRKNLETLIEAFAAYRVRAGTAAWDLVLIGDGPLALKLAAASRGLGIEENVRMPGFVQYPVLPAYYGLASAFVLPSVVEPWGLVVNEAMAAGLPVLVSSACGCAPDLVREGVNGFSFDPRDPGALADAMLRLAVNSSVADMGRASRTIVASYTPESFAVAMERAVDLARRHPSNERRTRR